MEGEAPRRQLRLHGRSLSWLEAGTGKPAVVLEAGFSGTAQAWSRVVPLLAAATRVIAYDRAGLGASDPDPTLPTIDRRLADLAALIEHAGATPCVLAGHSWGGILSRCLACHRPDLVAALVLVDPADLDMLGGLPGWVRPLVRAANDQVIVRLRPAGVRQEHRGMVASLPAIRALQSSCSMPDLPVLVLSAGRGIPRGVRRHWTAAQAQLARSLPKGRHLVVPDSGHAIPRRRPDLVGDLILQLVAGLRAGH